MQLTTLGLKLHKEQRSVVKLAVSLMPWLQDSVGGHKYDSLKPFFIDSYVSLCPAHVLHYKTGWIILSAFGSVLDVH